MSRFPSEPIAIIGMAGRFPGARNVDELWENLAAGRDSITRFTDEELAGVEHDFERVRNDPGFVKARGVLQDIESFDAGFFGFRPREAASLDPQQRIWFECAWEALESAGVAPAKFGGSVGVFAGGGYLDTYLLHNLCTDRNFIEELVRLRAVDAFQNIINNDKDFLPTRTSYLFDLTGPSINVQTACSTSLVAVVQACQALVLGDADVCIAGGISVQLPQVRGYLAQDGGMDSSDGRLRAFDAGANGTVFGNGVGAVVLKRLSDAVRDRDHVMAVLKGFAVNNDGAGKVSYIAPSPEGQAAVVRRAQEMAGVDPDTISYVEAHGTGTSMGDPIEVNALTGVFREKTDRRQFCGIGSIKSNIGHLDSASGVAGLIKTVLALRNELIPATVNYETPNPRIDFESSPFFVVSEAHPWPSGGPPRRAGVSSFGVGGTNAHVVVEEAPTSSPAGEAPDWQLLTWSARAPAALDERTEQLATRLEAPDVELADVGYSLVKGREDMPLRRFAVCLDRGDAVDLLRNGDARRLVTREAAPAPEEIVFMFPGQGSQHVGMARDLYETEGVFRDTLDHCADAAAEALGLDLRDLLYPGAGVDPEGAARELTQTRVAQPALFAVELALARLWQSWGVHPSAMIGHSVGEFVAAALADVFTLEEAVGLLVARGSLMQAQPTGSMLAVRAPEDRFRQLLGSDVSLAAVNAPELCVVSGTDEAIAAFGRRCAEAGVETRVLHTSHAFHSEMMDGALEPFTEAVAEVGPRAPRRPFISSCTGTWITEDEAVDPAYWARQLRQPVRFRDGIDTLRATTGRLYLEVGPGTTLSALARQCGSRGEIPVVSSLGHPTDERSHRAQLLEAVGRLWIHDVSVDWDTLFAGGERRRVPLPTYPFQRQRYWIEPPHGSTATPPTAPRQNEVTMSPALPDPVPAADRKPKVREALAHIFTDLSGIDFEPGDEALTFMEMGFDSLFLTQVSTALQNELGVKVKFRRMLEDLCTLDALTDHFDDVLPPDRFAAPAPVPVHAAPQPGPAVGVPAAAPPAIAAAPPPADASAVERLVHEQLRIMQQQLAVLGGGVTAPAASVAQAPLQPSAAPAAPAPAAPAPSVTAPDDDPEPPKKAFGAQARIETSSSGEMNAKQKACYEAFLHRYLTKTRRSKEFTQEHRKGMADPRAVTGFRPIWKEIVYPIVVDRSKGAKLWDLDGNEYVDLTCGFGSNFLGNQPDFIAKAIHEQVERGYEVGPQHPLTADVAALIRELTGMERVAFCNTGSEAVMGAMRQARTITGRKLIAIFTNSYHGIFDEVIVRGTRKLRSIAAAPGILASAVENVLVLDYDSPESLKTLRERGQELAAIMAEPVQSRNPKLQPREFLHELRKISDECGAALIFDEVITGFRISPGGAQEHFGVRADLATYGKIIGGGLPFAAIAGNAHFMDALDGGYWEFGDDSYPEVGVTYFAGTFVRHPLALAAAKASLEHLKEQGPELQRKLNERTTAFVTELNDHFDSVGAKVHIDQFGSLCRITVSEDETHGPLLYYWLRDKGVHVWEGFGTFLTTAHTEEDVRLIIDAFKDSIEELQEAELMSGGPGTAPSPGPRLEPGQIPLTDAQSEIWHASQMGDIASCSYNESFTLDLHGPLDRDLFHDALDLVSKRHEALHLRFDPSGEFQHKVPPEAPPLPLIDWSDLSAEEQEASWPAVLESHATQPFDLENGPMIRNELYKLGAEEHVLVSTAHHIVFDGWSAGVYIDEVGSAYSALVRGERPELPPAPLFSEYAEAERREIDSPEGSSTMAYWKDRFAVAPEPLELPTDRPRPASKSYRGASIHWDFADSTYAAVKAAAARNNTTLYTLLLTAYSAFLHRLTGQTDLVVGIPTAGQAIVGEYSLIGHCVNILPLRSFPRPDVPFKAFLKEAGSALLDAQENQPATLGAILRAVSVPRSPGRSPLVEVIFNLNRKLPGEGMEGLTTRIHEVEKKAINWDMFLNCSEEDGRLTTDFDYNTELFDEATIRRWLAGFETLLLSVAKDAAVPLGSLPVQTTAERDALLQQGRGPVLELPSESLPALIGSRAAAHPDRIAVRWGDDSVTYGQLDERANQISRHLQKMGVGEGTGVGVCLSRSTVLPAVLLGVMRAGGFYIPMDPGHPRSRTDFIVQDAGLRWFVTESSLRETLQASDDGVLVLDHVLAEIAAEPSDPVEAPAHDSPAYVLYTSGSTGEPKGVAVSHRALTNFILSMKERPGIGEDDVLLAVTTLSFDIAGLELYLPLVAGAQVLLAPDEVAEDAEQLKSTIAQAGVTVMQATPTHWRLLLEAGWTGAPSLKVLAGGEALPRDIADRLVAGCSEVWNMYGPTETTIWSTCHEVTEADTLEAVPIGRPIANTTVYVVDGSLDLTPPGVPGELCIGGEGVATGYLGQRALTADRFVPDPFADGGRMYRTGDLCRWTSAGTLEFLGRLDNQVKIRGFRVELGEVEAALVSHPAVRAAAATRREDRPGDVRLAGYIVHEPGQFVSPDELRRYLRERLPEYMCPQNLVSLSAIPMTPNGKVDRRALPEPQIAEAVPEQHEVAASPTEEHVLQVWKDVLGVRRMGIGDDFFDLGGHSILATRIVTRLRREIEPALTLRQIFEAPTVKLLSEEIEALQLARGNGTEGRDGDVDREELVF